MAEVQSTFPPPPWQYINQYTDDNIKRNRAPPPPPPIQDNYSMFGAPFSSDEAIIRPLEASGMRRLYPSNYDHKKELKKINLSIVFNFLDLIDMLIRAPDSLKRSEKLDDLHLLFVNMHHLINEFRPHQARETLRVMMERQKQERLEVAQRFRNHLDKVKEILEETINAIPENNMDNKLLLSTDLAFSGVSVKEEPMDTSPVDTLDQMMCDIVDGLN